MSHPPDRKVTISIDPGVLSVVDTYVASHPNSSRSGVFEEAVRAWYRQMLDQADLEYYSSQTPEELESNKAWSAITTSAAKEILK